MQKPPPRNSTLIQTSSVKVEQKGQELTAKLAEFDRLCHAPALQEAGRTEQLRAIVNKFTQCAEEPDIQILRTVADYARTFRADTNQAMTALNPLLSPMQEVINRLNPG